jgi:hypothetical protein
MAKIEIETKENRNITVGVTQGAAAGKSFLSRASTFCGTGSS